MTVTFSETMTVTIMFMKQYAPFTLLVKKGSQYKVFLIKAA